MLGGGGVAGIAWTTGLLFGLSERGVDLRTAETILGTSAGSAVAAQLSSDLVKELFDRQVEPAQQTRELAPSSHLFELLERALTTANNLRDRSEHVRHIGRWALEAPTVTEAERRAVIRRALAESRVAWRGASDRGCRYGNGRDENIRSPLGNKSGRRGRCQLRSTRHMTCLFTIDGRRYMDGGARSSDNADLLRSAMPAP